MIFRRLIRRRHRDRELAREIAAYLAAEQEENQALGMSADEAARRAHLAFGSTRRVHETLWQQNSIAWLEGFLRDLSYASRTLARTPGFAFTIIVIIALGVGANVAVFSVMNAVLLKSLPVADPQRVFFLNIDGPPDGANNSGNDATSFSWPVYQALRRQKHAFADAMAYVPLAFAGKVAVRFGHEPQEAQGEMVSGNYFAGLGVSMVRGRSLEPADEAQHAPVVVLSYSYWTRRFARTSTVIGKTLYIKGAPFTIVGIAGAGFEGTEPGASFDFWIPLQSRTEFNAWGVPANGGKTYLDRPDWWCLRVLARLAPGVSPRQALAQAQVTLAQSAYIGLGRPRPGSHQPVLQLQPGRAFAGYEDQYGMPLRVMMAMVSLVLFIALSNVAMLVVARNANRRREFSVRLSLGAARALLARQLLAESLLLVALGGALAWFLAGAGTRALAGWAHIDASLAPDPRALLYTIALLALATLFFGLLPLRTSLAGGTTLVLKSTAAVAEGSRTRSRAGQAVVALQMAFCLALLVGAGLLVRTLRSLNMIPLGQNTRNLVAFGVNPQHLHTLDEGVLFYQQLLTRLRALPGVESASLVENRPGSGWSNNASAPWIDGHKAPNGEWPQGHTRMNTVASDYFHTLGVPVLAGRDFTDGDTQHTANVVIVNQTFAQRFLPGQTPVGHSVGNANGTEHAQIVGVVKDHKYTSIDEAPLPMLWIPYTQSHGVGELHVEMRVHGDPLAILPTVQTLLLSLDPDLPLLQPRLQQTQFEQSIAQQVLFARLAECFGVLAIVLVATGMYGTLAYRVSSRMPEIGVRMALGAQRGQVVWMVLRSTLLVTGAGLLVGLPLAMLLARSLASSLYHVTTMDTSSYGVAIFCVAAVALAASVLPATRAARIEPMQALRAE